MQYRIAKFYAGHYGYRLYFELQAYNAVYEKWYQVKHALDIEFIKSECLIKGIDFQSLEIVYIEKPE